MLFKSVAILSVAALAVAAPLQQERRSIDLFKRGSNIVDADVNAQVGKSTSADVAATVSKAGDITADVDAQVGKLLGLDLDLDVGLGRLLRGLLGGLFHHKRDEILSIEDLVKRSGDILNADIDATVGQKTKASVDAVLTKSGELTADVDAKVGRLLGLNVDADVGLGKLLRGLLGGLFHHKRDEITLLSDVELSHLLSANVDLRVGLSKLLHSLLKVDVDVSKRSLIDSNTDAALNQNGLGLGSLTTVGKDISAAVGAIVTPESTAAGVKGQVGQVQTDTEALLNKSGLALGSYVKDDKSTLGLGSIINKDGTNTALIGNLGQLLGVKVDATTTPILKGLLRGLLGKN